MKPATPPLGDVQHGKPPLEGGEVLHLFQAVGASGSGVNITVPAGETWLINNAAITLNTSADLFNRTVHIKLVMPTNVTVALTASAAVQTASNTYEWLYGLGLENAAAVVDARVVGSLPMTFVIGASGSRVEFNVQNVRPGDILSLINIEYQRWRS